jgi:hypothetical protein
MAAFCYTCGHYFFGDRWAKKHRYGDFTEDVVAALWRRDGEPHIGLCEGIEHAHWFVWCADSDGLRVAFLPYRPGEWPTREQCMTALAAAGREVILLAGKGTKTKGGKGGKGK